MTDLSKVDGVLGGDRTDLYDANLEDRPGWPTYAAAFGAGVAEGVGVVAQYAAHGAWEVSKRTGKWGGKAAWTVGKYGLKGATAALKYGGQQLYAMAQEAGELYLAEEYAH